MDSKLLTESSWRPLAQKWKIKDNGLQRVLAAYEKLDDDDHAERLKGIAKISQLAATLKSAKEITAITAVVKYLNEVESAAESEQREIAKARVTAKQAEAEAKKQEKEQDTYEAKLLAAFQKLKGGRDLSYEFIVCDANPHCALMVAPRITPQHKEQLTRLTGGSKRFLHVGACHFENGKFTFTLGRPATGLARKLQDSIKNFTGRKLPILVGTESADEDDG